MRRLNSYKGHMGIALRIALFSWVITLATLCIFVFITVPRQKETFLRNLESKANSVAVSLRDVAAGAAVNEDFASLVSASQTLLAGDPDLEFLIIMRNDGFALINQQSGWRVEPSIDRYWQPVERKSTGVLETVQGLNQRVFHFAQPFDYSGIEWGWIHVGLSLKAYDKSVTELYQNTILLALGCITFSLLASLVFSAQMVRPILRLRQMVQQIADGDLSVRAEIFRRDEVGHLAESVNTMAEALLRRDRIMESVSHAAQQFLHGTHWETVIQDVMSKIGQAADARQTALYEQRTDTTGALYGHLRFEWARPGSRLIQSNPPLQTIFIPAQGQAGWSDYLWRNQLIAGPVDATDLAEKEAIMEHGVLSLMVIPIFVDGDWWGSFCLGDSLRERLWTEAEQDSLRAATDMLGATIARQRAQEAVLEAKATLEQRVEERTMELMDQVAAKEQALSQLATAQSSLLEMSRAAGMAEVATGVLHNVGNVLNSVNVSCNLLVEQLRESRMGNVGKVADLLSGSEADIASFLTTDPRGCQIPAYLRSLGNALAEEQRVLFAEAEALHARIDHIKEIVTMQQTYGRVMGVLETLAPEQLMEDALKLNAEALKRHGITVRREYSPLPAVTVDKHKILQILLNLISNAKYACAYGQKEKSIILRIDSPSQDRVRMEVTDDGIGISQENLIRIFQHGFTTRKDGHGFGLHSGALAARELGGSLNVRSDGLNRGATFTLEIPIRPSERE